MRHHLLRAAFGALAVILTGAVAGPTSASTATTAQAASMIPPSCQVAFELDFMPALTPAGTVDAQGMAGLVGCQLLQDNGAKLLSATVTGSTATATADPLICLLLTITGNAKFVWNTDTNTKKTSMFTFVINTNPANGTITLQATSTSGAMHPFTITAVPVTPVIDGTCLTGVQRLYVLNAVLVFS